MQFEVPSMPREPQNPDFWAQSPDVGPTPRMIPSKTLRNW